MNVKDVQSRVNEIRSRSGDDEDAHGLEDVLHQDVLKAIATGECEDPVECAKLALTTLDIKFARWCA